MAKHEWTHLPNSRKYQKEDVLIEFMDIGPAGSLRFCRAGREAIGYVELIYRGLALWPDTLRTWNDGSPVSNVERQRMVEDLLDLARDTGMRVEIIQ